VINIGMEILNIRKRGCENTMFFIRNSTNQNNSVED
jgi:hypothetical protein